MRISPVAAFWAACAAASIILAPIAQAAPPTGQQIKPAPQTCTTTNVGSTCISPGNAQINDAPPFVNNFPMYGTFPWIL
jgi:hypothetical protein